MLTSGNKFQMTPKSESAAAAQTSIVEGGCVAHPRPTVPATFVEAWAKSGGSRYGLTQEAYFAVLAEVGAKCLPQNATDSEQISFYGGLRHEELALARACAAGFEPAWDEFLTRYREKLYDAARAIARDDATGRELADSLYADLFGTTVRDGTRVSKLNYYTGRGSLEGWLRTVLAQEFVNRYRVAKRTVSLDEKTEQGAQFVAPQQEGRGDRTESRLNVAIDAALAALAAEERLLLSAYYLDGRTLAEIGRMLSVHESTISRKLEKLVTRLRSDIVKQLVKSGMDRAQAVEAMVGADVRDLTVDVRHRLAQDSATKSFYGKETERG